MQHCLMHTETKLTPNRSYLIGNYVSSPFSLLAHFLFKLHQAAKGKSKMYYEESLPQDKDI